MQLRGFVSVSAGFKFIFLLVLLAWELLSMFEWWLISRWVWLDGHVMAEWGLRFVNSLLTGLFVVQ